VLVTRLIRYYDTVVAGAQCGVSVCGALAGACAGQRLATFRRHTLTGLLIRRAFYQSAYGLLLRRREGPSYLSVAMIDLDNLERLNDTHGHSIGDQALVAVGGALRLACPPTSLIARFGGEEFVVADTYRTDDLLDIAEQLRMAIAAIDFPVTASIGIATRPLAASFAPAEHELIDDLVNLADTAMYAAKHAGGNQSQSAHMPHADPNGSPA
jgi:diguanylate cyclase (GGDEF)-like protein